MVAEFEYRALDTGSAEHPTAQPWWPLIRNVCPRKKHKVTETPLETSPTGQMPEQGAEAHRVDRSVAR